MAARKTTSKKSRKRPSSSGSDPKSKRIVRGKMQETMHEFKEHDLESGRSGRKVKNPKQAIAIGLSEARRSGAKIPPSPNKKSSSGGRAKKAATKKTGSSRSAKRAPAKRTSTKRAPAKKSAAKKTSARRGPARKAAAKKRR